MRRDQQWTNPRGLTGAWAQAEGVKGGRTDEGHSGGIRHMAQWRRDEPRRLVGRRVGTKSRWTIIHTKSVCGERVRESGELMLKATVRGSVGVGGTG